MWAFPLVTEPHNGFTTEGWDVVLDFLRLSYRGAQVAKQAQLATRTRTGGSRVRMEGKQGDLGPWQVERSVPVDSAIGVFPVDTNSGTVPVQTQKTRES